MSETAPPRVNDDFDKARDDLDYNALADALEAQGDVIEAKRFRDLATRQPEIEARAAAKRKALDEQRQLDLQDQKLRIQEERAKPKPLHDPLSDATSYEGLREQLEKLFDVKSPTSQRPPIGQAIPKPGK